MTTRSLKAALLFLLASCKHEQPATDAGMGGVDAPVGAPARLVKEDAVSFTYEPSVNVGRTRIYFDNATAGAPTVRLPSDDTFPIPAGGRVTLTAPAAGFAFSITEADGGVTHEGPYALIPGRIYVYNVDASARYAIQSQDYSSLGFGGQDPRDRAIVGAWLFGPVIAHAYFTPLPDEISVTVDAGDIAGMLGVARDARSTFVRVAGAAPSCSRGAGGRVCDLGAGEITFQRDGESDIPSATVYVDNAYADEVNIRVDGALVGRVKPNGLLRVHLSASAHTLGALAASGTVREQAPHALAEWKRYVWTPEKKRSFAVETRDYGSTLPTTGVPPRPEHIDAPGFFETDADFLFEPFPETVRSTALISTTRKRLVKR